MDHIPENTLKLICKYIENKFGIVIQSHQTDSLEKYLIRICGTKDYSNIDEYLNKLCFDSGNSPLIKDLCANITVDESYFFRDQSQMDFLQQAFLPELIRKRRAEGRHELRIWSAGCSNGQELYTLLIMLDMLLPDNELWDIYAIGTDINEEVLARARAGKYSYLSFRTTPESIQSAYFEPADGAQSELIYQVRKIAKFSHLNLKEFDRYPLVVNCKTGIDLILCRNVFIYLDYDVVTKIIASFLKCMDKDSILMLGPSDIIHNQIEGAELCRNKGVIYYKQAKEHIDKQVKVEKTFEKKQTIYPIISDTLPSSEKEVSAKSINCQSVDSVSEGAVEKEEVLEVSTLQKIALQCANSAEYEKGLEMIEKCIQQDEFDADSYYIKGLISLGLKKFSDAGAFFKSALFLRNQFPEAAYQLSVCMKLQGDVDSGRKMMASALTMANDLDPEKNLIDMPGVTISEFREVLKDEIERSDQGRVQ
ncbi:MAG: hypothetical protein P1U34_04060 [Coxiellaceae bacterium]|nr:hypothetical protein [Coxiellaceae bacterium]